jgi:hypothetical protein
MEREENNDRERNNKKLNNWRSTKTDSEWRSYSKPRCFFRVATVITEIFNKYF